MEHQPATATAAAAPRPNGLRPSNHLVVTHEGRKPLFAAASNARDKTTDSRTNGAAQASPRPKPGRLAVEAGNRPALGVGLGLARRTKSESQPTRNSGANGDGNINDNHSSGSGSGNSVSLVSPGGTRIPRPSSSTSSSAFHRRRPISLAEAFRLAEDEEAEAKRAQALDGSPSPAPRSWRARGARDEAKMRQMLGQDHLDTKARSRQAAGESSDRNPSKPTAESAPMEPGPQEEKATPPRNHMQTWKPSPRVSPVRHENPKSPPPDHHSGSDGHDIPDLVPGIEDIPLPSVEAADRGPNRSPRRNNAIASPEKSFDWQVEADFTAGDLQISDSPRIRVESNRPFANRPSLVSTDDKISIRSPPRLTHPGSRNTKLDEIRARELKPTNQILAEKSQPRQSNTKLDEIRAREKAVEAQIPIPDRNQLRPKNTKLDEIRQREAEGLSKRAYASARLEEIREQNSTSRSVSPEEARPRSGKQGEHPDQRKATPGGGQDKRLPTRTKPVLGNGERIPDTPITVFKNRRTTERGANGGNFEKEATDKGADDKRDSHDLLRRLARATSASPAPEPDASSKRPPSPRRETNGDEPRPKPSALARFPDKGRKMPAAIASSRDKDGPKPTVGFTGLRRSESLDPAKSKRSSVQSEADPTDRIEAEILLFAPQENQSERGSVRALSPQPSSDDDELAEATPRADRHVFASMPTPKVTGAYVETPATLKVERRRDEADERRQGRRAHRDAAVVFGDEKAGLEWRRRDQDAASDPGTSDYNRDGDAVSAAVALRRRRRARSLPRRRPPLRNSAKLPSVKGDLLELQRIHNIDDSTMDDVEDILLGRRRSERLELLQEDDGIGGSDDEQPLVKREDSSEADSGEPKLNGKYGVKDTALFDRMSKSLYAGLWNIRTAKQGIERLEDRFSHAGTRLEPAPGADTKAPLSEEPDVDMRKIPAKHEEHCAACLAQPSPEAMTYIHLPVPRLYYTTPRFRLSLLGLVLAVASLWLTLESAMCARYCRPATCSSGECVYSFDDPTFGAALPVKLDQWTTGGHGRALLGRAADEALDLVADLEDLALGRSISDVPLRGMSPAQKRQHRRRLAKRGLPVGSSSSTADPPPPEQRAKWEAWRRARLARDRRREVREMGYFDAAGGRDEGAAIGDDERVG
ncbi:hypothetical protein HRG_001092 [Hirsutella rhossiliensis]|uniref:Uncharacterized protein n=1 Tax=Hirsutella rhossiliensis TaxID=111463 RepID=A0A9P8SP13_9HYPO|nr:uncharacterized protein HRG_01092 [Hirsutella rhossiliensis]KAH0968450.1 hypothetical protein HRG_01092 [Hirsutella rhossiliensis]